MSIPKPIGRQGFTAIWFDRDWRSLLIFAEETLAVTDKIPRFETEAGREMREKGASGKLGKGPGRRWSPAAKLCKLSTW